MDILWMGLLEVALCVWAVAVSSIAACAPDSWAVVLALLRYFVIDRDFWLVWLGWLGWFGRLSRIHDKDDGRLLSYNAHVNAV